MAKNVYLDFRLKQINETRSYLLREYNEIKEEIKNLENVVEYTIQKQWKHIVLVVREILRTKLRVRRTKQNILMLVSNYSVCGKKKSRFIKNKEPSGLLSKIGIRILFKNPLIGGILF